MFIYSLIKHTKTQSEARAGRCLRQKCISSSQVRTDVSSIAVTYMLVEEKKILLLFYICANIMSETILFLKVATQLITGSSQNIYQYTAYQ